MKISLQRSLFLILFAIIVNTQNSTAFYKSTTKNISTIQLASLFQDHMVLQRDMKIPVWGKGIPGTKITVNFAGTTKNTLVSTNGKWLLKLPAFKASLVPRTMIISSSSDTNTLEITDILVGEVWICSGQSNMQFSTNSVPEIKKLIPSATNIRSFKVQNTVAFEPQDNCGGTWVDGHPDSAVAFSFAYFLEEAIDIPIGIIQTSWGSSSLEAWMPRDMTSTVPHFKMMMDEFDADTISQNKINNILNGPKPWSRTDDVFLRRQSNILYNAMMHPLIPYACRGLVWYQGERNTQSMFGMLKEPWFSRNSGMLKYGTTLKEWILKYRSSWNQKEMDFLIVMLPGYGSILKESTEQNPKNPNAYSWAWMRESQLKALELPNTSVANTIDLGDVKNIHPKDKLPVGQRLALLAQHNVLKMKVTASGPTFKKVKTKNNSITVFFKNVKKLKTTDGKPPREFWLADDSKNWVPAKATIKGKTVILSSSKLIHPKYVRYAFTGKPNVNLVNEANLPTYPFRTDNFKP
ncbi:sialate O-acetylesterase [Wenyingzhuangia sp. 2_MG-2023]|uniref:sialate O-acetylesterase n=1 Tax=Wenyingzhuangia sp. 2_MG-2023 TaxID=3062639 RepID=UPI0026E277B3|nr:sialate O-acetylesterase [Wenyingzhuangia sp. 2_MG-2023]MDO6736310.1 sialate O-acetylesterase [Wenyingzhuangia sp. 2_MG-2023]